jgi:serine palmitoyltransferase
MQNSFDLQIDMGLELNMAALLDAESPKFYSQEFSTVPCVIFALERRGTLIVANRGIDFPTPTDLQISRSNVRRFNHSDLKSRTVVHLGVEEEHRIHRGPLMRRFIVTENAYERDSAGFIRL